MLQNCKEVYSLEESLNILNKYANNLTPRQYDNIKSIICSFAIENMHLNEEDILNGIAIQKGDKSVLEITQNYKAQWGCL
ncbi:MULTISPECIES: hypothetical protein [Campylobacter]|uniref:Uncharacterized protein n=1 Tax=Campylobacter helveticus TaxID=28898 RepID=A0AAX2UIH1_9BACT|nr:MULTISPECIES: hypothetical protein [Campylobacter]ARE81474.1 hypothetical protein CHELV3228_b0010 [Campylobacter helveticus]EAI3917906.1 hypothetical protein [Campylobacter upsaliensis]EAI4345277.1 hypothetical protein [Campylobacter upsaliensis]EAI8173302.1 hypothetical protein [Campylobacter upsaliensis]EAJ0412398.1 hypothetical protein [Campylobacter upsaliensis]